MQDELEDNLDISWIQEHEKLTNINNNYCREPISNIQLCCVYINQQSSIDNIEIENLELQGGNEVNEGKSGTSVITQEKILHLVQNKKIRMINGNSVKYSLKDILLYVVDIEPHVLQSFSQTQMDDIGNTSKMFLKTCSLFDNINVPQSIFIFHSLATLYFIMQERPNKKPLPIPVIIPKSILKTKKIIDGGENGEHKKKNTKKVIIIEPSSDAKSSMQNFPLTRRRRTK